MSSLLEAESTLTNRYQTTIPEMVRSALHLEKWDKIRYSIRSNGEVVLTRIDTAENNDQILENFLLFLANELKKHPYRIQTMDSCFIQRLQALTQTIDINLNTPLSADDD